MDKNKPLFMRTSWWIWVIIVISGLGILGSVASYFNPTTETSKQQTKSIKQNAINQETERKVEKLRLDITNSFNEVVGINIFTKSYLEHIADNHFEITLTVNDKWYYLKEYQQERLLEDAWQYFNYLGVEHNLRTDEDMPWKVVFIDTYDKELAKQGWW